MNSIGWFSWYMKELYGFNWLYHDYKYYRLEENNHIDFSRDQIMDMFNAYLDSQYAKDTPIIDGALEKLQEWKKAGHELYIITARGDFQREITEYQIEKNFPWFFEKMFIVWDARGNHTSKAEVCKEIWATVLIEDSMDNCLDAAAQWIRTYLLSRPRNMRRKDEHPLIKKVTEREQIDI